MSVYTRLEALGLVLPPPPPLGGLYIPVRQVGNLLYTSGSGPTREGVPVFTGKVGGEISLETAQEAARLCILNTLACLHAYLGDLDRIVQVVKLLGFVASVPSFTRQPEVMNGASRLLTELFGERGGHARSAIGTNVLPGDIPVEIELILEV